MNFTPIDMATWPRQQYFYYFTKMAPMGFTVNAKLDISRTQEALHARDLRFFPAYLYVTSKVLATMPEFRIGTNNDGQLGYFDVLNPSYTIIHENHQISSCWSAYTEDFATFYARVEADEALAAKATGPMGKPDQPVNSFEAGMMPWLHFDGYTPLPTNGLPNFQPVLQAGRYADGQLPLSITAHHAVADGYHVSELFNRLQDAFDHPDWLN